MSPDKQVEYDKRYHDIVGQEPKADVVALVNAVDYAVKRIGVDHVALSSDFNHGGGVTGWSDVGELPNVTKELQRRGYPLHKSTSCGAATSCVSGRPRSTRVIRRIGRRRRADAGGGARTRLMWRMNHVYADMRTTIFEEMSALARERGAINLGQGFPDTIGPPELLNAAADAVLAGPNQYAPSSGLPALRAAVAAHYRRFQALDFGPDDVIVTSGATEAIAAALLAIVSPGDEVIVFEPMYDAYRPLIERAGGVPRPVTLRPPDWTLPIDDVARAIGSRTAAILFNNPNNPAARVFSRRELSALADLCVAHDLVAICDEVWEHVVFDGAAHVPLIGLPGMAARAVKIGSAGKIFGLTGWKVGFVAAAPALLQPIARAHQFLTFSTPPNLQSAVAYGLGLDDTFFARSRTALERSRDRLVAGLKAAGFTMLPSQGTYFVTIDLAASGVDGTDTALADRMLREAGVAGIPLSPFYMSAHAPDGLVRLCFAKADDVLADAATRLGRWLADQKAGSTARL